MNILFYGVLDTISLAMYEDLADALREKHNIAFEFGGVVRKKDVAEQIVKERGYPIGMENPDIMFVSDFRVYPRDRNCIVINVEHGLGSKNDYNYPDTPHDTDYLFCASKWISKKFITTKTNFIATGMPKLDKVVKKRSGDKTILIAPTYNEEYNCLNIIKDNIRDLSEKYKVIIKPHENDTTDWGLYGAQVMHNYNIADLFSICDVVVSDVSSAYLEFMALNRPTVVCETEFMKQRKLERPEAHEYYFQNGASAVISQGNELLDAVDAALNDRINLQRFINSRKLLSYRGKSIKRIIKVLRKIEAKI